jgi:hypothetical protein
MSFRQNSKRNCGILREMLLRKLNSKWRAEWMRGELIVADEDGEQVVGAIFAGSFLRAKLVSRQPASLPSSPWQQAET